MIQAFGKYMVMLYSIFLKPEKFSIYWKRFVDEIIQLGLKSLFIVIFCICIYAYNSGSCQIKKKYICNDNFCLYKEFNVFLKNQEFLKKLEILFMYFFCYLY